MSETPAEAAARFRGVKRQLMEAAGLREPLSPSQALRLRTATWLSIAKQNREVRILAGDVADYGELVGLAEAVNSLLPTEMPRLQINLVGRNLCRECRAVECPEVAELVPVPIARTDVPPSQAMPAPADALSEPMPSKAIFRCDGDRG